VGDNGYLAKLSLTGTVEEFYTVSGDLEGLTNGADGDSRLYIGVENYPTIKEFPGTRTWLLPEMAFGDTNSRLEALAFVPNEYCDLLNYNNGHGSVFESGGLFLAGHQGDGRIYVYDINVNGSSVVFVGAYGPWGRTDLASLDFHYESGKLYALWDSSNIMGRLTRGLALEQEWSLPAGGVEEEALCVFGCVPATIVIGEDPAATHRVWLYDGFSINCDLNISVAVELEGVIVDVVRTVKFTLTDCETGQSEEREEAIQFENGLGYVVLDGVSPEMDWISAVEGHTLRRLLPLTEEVLFTGPNRLLTGDFSNPPWVPQDNLVDIQDFAILCIYWNQPIDPTVGYHADATADGIQDVADFTGIQINFAAVGDAISGCSHSELGTKVAPLQMAKD
jgi:hypothetical protein